MDKMTFPLEKCAFTFHSRVERYFNNGPHVKPLFEHLSHSGLSFVAISSKLEEDIRKIYPSAKCVLIPNGVDMTTIARKRRCKSELRKELGIPEDAFAVGQVGRFDKVKNHLFTIDVFNIIVNKNDKAILVLIGTGTEQEIELIKSRIAYYNLQDHVIMLGLREDATSLMNCFDVLIHPSLSESFSLVLVEAQVNNIRCVASDAIPNEVICNKNCFQLSLDAPKEKWAELIMGKEESVGNSSISQFDINVVIDKHIELYKQISS
jgi:glycosyltransferase involved in cell wall biosynthesis